MLAIPDPFWYNNCDFFRFYEPLEVFMDKAALRKEIREQKRAMTPEQIVAASEELAKQFFASGLYRQAKSVYGYLPYNQEVRTVPILEQALRDGKRVAVPKVSVIPCALSGWRI